MSEATLSEESCVYHTINIRSPIILYQDTVIEVILFGSQVVVMVDFTHVVLQPTPTHARASYPSYPKSSSTFHYVVGSSV